MQRCPTLRENFRTGCTAMGIEAALATLSFPRSKSLSRARTIKINRNLAHFRLLPVHLWKWGQWKWGQCANLDRMTGVPALGFQDS
jgi:hypothetical protein